MAQLVNLEELVEDWTLLDAERALLVGKWGSTRVGFASLLKFFQRDGFFPSKRAQFPTEVVDFVAAQLAVPAADVDGYGWAGRTNAYHRGEVRAFLGVRECSSDDAERLTAWLATEVACAERSSDRVRVELVARCRAEQLALPTPPRIGRIVRSALARAERHLTSQVVDRLRRPVRQRLDNLISDDHLIEGDSETSVLTRVKSSPGNVSLDSLLTEIAKLRLVREIRVPPAAFGSVAPKVLHGWRARAAVEAPSHLRGVGARISSDTTRSRCRSSLIGPGRSRHIEGSENSWDEVALVHNSI